METVVRYDTKRDFGGPKGPETRREYNARFSHDSGPPVIVPENFRYVWDWFWEIAGRREVSQAGPVPISHREVEAWQTNFRTTLREEEIRMLVAMDDVYLSQSAKEHEATMARRKSAKTAAPMRKRR